MMIMMALNEDDVADPLYACVTCLKDEELETVEDQIEQDVVAAFMAAGHSPHDEETAEEMCSCVDEKLCGLYSRERAKRV